MYFTLLYRLYWSAFAKFYFLLFDRKSVVLPEKYLDFTLVRDFEPEKIFPFKTGLYKNNKGEQVVLKIWQGKFPDMEYCNIIHQINVLKTVNNVHNRIQRKLTGHLKNIGFPKLVSYKINRNQVIFLTEFVSAPPLLDQSISAQIKTFENVIEYFKLIGENCTSNERTLISEKNNLYYLFIFPVIWLYALSQNPWQLKLLLIILPVYLKTCLNIKSGKLFFVHGDLNFGNILVNSKGITILDTEQACFTYPEFEIAGSLSVQGVPDQIKSYLLKKHSINNNLIFAILNCNVHNLMWHPPQVHLNRYINRLNHSLSAYYGYGQ